MKLTKQKLELLILESMNDDFLIRRRYSVEFFINTISTLINASSEDIDEGITGSFFTHHVEAFESLSGPRGILDMFTAYENTSPKETISFIFKLDTYGDARNNLSAYLGNLHYDPNAITNQRPGNTLEQIGEECVVRYQHNDRSLAIDVSKKNK